MINQNYVEYLIKCGFNDAEIETKLKEKEIMKNLYFSKKDKVQREITSSTYERCIKRETKDVENFLTRR